MNAAQVLPFNFQKELLGVAIRFGDVKEIAGANDHPFIEIAHQVCKIEGKAGGSYTDEIPWCSSGLNLWYLIMVGQYRFDLVEKWLNRRNQAYLIPMIRVYCEPFMRPQPALNFIEPTWSALAVSWATWGYPVPSGQERPGDIMTMTRVGGNHVGLLIRKGYVFNTVYGANQSNRVCESDTYLRARLSAVRRFAA